MHTTTRNDTTNREDDKRVFKPVLSSLRADDQANHCPEFRLLVSSRQSFLYGSSGSLLRSGRIAEPKPDFQSRERVTQVEDDKSSSQKDQQALCQDNPGILTFPKF